MDKFKDKYRIPSARANWWDYKNGIYFITICTSQRVNYFGKIWQNKMLKSEIGQIAQRCWEELPLHFPFIELDTYVIMPNHLHGILIINKTSTSASRIESFPQKQMSAISPGQGSLASVIRSYKSAVTNHVHKLEVQFKWQERYFDNIIRNELSWNNIIYYINHNIENWNSDKFYGIEA